MVFDRTENEPEEWDPEEEFYDSESDGLTIPQVSTGEDGPEDELSDLSSAIDTPTVSASETDVPSDVLQTFWALVLVLNAAVLVVSLGLLLAIFEGDLLRSGALVAAGIVLFGFAGRRYRRFRNDDSDVAGDSDDDSTGDDETATSAGSDAAETTSGNAPQHRSPTRNDSP